MFSFLLATTLTLSPTMTPDEQSGHHCGDSMELEIPQIEPEKPGEEYTGEKPRIDLGEPWFPSDEKPEVLINN